MLNVLSIDVEEYFQVSAFEEAVDRSQWEHFPSRVVESTRRILRLLSRYDTRATFFVLGWIAERHPELVREIAADGHEIASHGYWHSLVYRQSRSDFEQDIAMSLRALKAAVPDAQILGYRAPSFSIVDESLWALDVLADLGLAYDSSVFPVSWHDRYGIAGAPRFAHRTRRDLLEIPATTMRLAGCNWPVAGGGYFRLLPLWLTRRAIAGLNAERQSAMIYLHPWEFDPDQPRIERASIRSRFRHYIHLRHTEGRLEALLREFRFAPIRTVFADLLASGCVSSAPQ